MLNPVEENPLLEVTAVLATILAAAISPVDILVGDKAPCTPKDPVTCKLLDTKTGLSK